MKIGLVSPYDYAYPGGVTEHVARLDENFRRLGHTVRIIAPSSSDEIDLVNGNVYKVGSPVSVPANGSVARVTLSLKLAGRVKEILRQERFDVIHIHEPLAPALPLSVLRHSDAINVGTFHACAETNFAYFYGKPVLKRFVRKLHGRIAVSQPAMDFVSQYFPGDYAIIPNGIDSTRFEKDVAPIQEFCDGMFNILFVGRYHERRKGLKYLLRALEFVRRKFPRTRLIIAGRGKEKGYQRYLRKHDIEDVVFVGFVSEEDLPRYYRTCDVFCAPSTGQESFGIILLEAMAAGRPVVATDISGYASVLTHGREGLLVRPKDEEALATALMDLLGNPTLRARMGSVGRETARKYTWEKVANSILNYYEEVLAFDSEIIWVPDGKKTKIGAKISALGSKLKEW